MNKYYLYTLSLISLFLSSPSNAMRVSIVNDITDEFMSSGTYANHLSFREALNRIEKPETNIRMSKVKRTLNTAKEIISASDKEIDNKMKEMTGFPHILSSSQKLLSLCKEVTDNEKSNEDDIIATSFLLESLASKL